MNGLNQSVAALSTTKTNDLNRNEAITATPEIRTTLVHKQQKTTPSDAGLFFYLYVSAFFCPALP